MRIVRCATPSEVLDLVGTRLRDVRAEGELTLGLMRRMVDSGSNPWGDDHTFLVALEDDQPVAVVTRTGAHPALIVGLVDPSAEVCRALAGAMLPEESGLSGVNGPQPWSDVFAPTWAAAAGVTAVHFRDARAFELHAVIRPQLPEGGYRPASPDDHELHTEWLVAFGDDIGERLEPEFASSQVTRLTELGDLAVWERDGAPVSMAAIVRRTPWSSTIADVYTPPALRGNGYASAVVAELSQRELDAGREWCSLFADVANPTSNHIYLDLGYEPKCDFRHYVFSM
jgi:uncharacterized protein